MHKCAFAIFFMCCIAVQAKAQWPEASSSTAVNSFLWRVVSQDTSRVKALLKKGCSYLDTYNENAREADSAIVYFKQAFVLSDEMHLDTYKNQSIHWLGEAYMAKGDVTSGVHYFQELIDIYRAHDNKGEMAKTAYWLGANRYGKNIELGLLLSWLKFSDSLYCSLHDLKGEAAAKTFLAYDYYIDGNMDNAEQIGLRALQLYKELKHPQIYNIYYILCVIDRYKGNLNKALGYAIGAVNAKEQAHDSIPGDEYAGELGLVYQELGQSAQCIEWYRKAIAIRERIHRDPVSIYWTQNLMVKELVKLDRSEEALTESIAVAKRNPVTDSLCLAVQEQTLGYCYNALNQIAEAERHYQEMTRLYELLNAIENKRSGACCANAEFFSIAQQDIGTFYLQHQRYAEARPHLETSLAVSFPFITLPRQIAIHQMLFTLDSAAGNYVSAIKHFRQYQELRDSVFSESKNKQIASLEIEFDTRRKEQNIELLKKGSLLQDAKLKQAAFVRNIILLGILVLIVLIVLLFNRYRFKQRANMQLESQQRDLRMLVKEKEWLVKEIHHRVKNNLHIVAGLLDSQAAFLKSDEALEAIQDTQHRVFAMSLIHQKLYQSDRLSVTEMPAYIQEIVAYLETAFSARRRIRFHLDIARVELAISYVVPLGLILNEAITNALKYAFPDGRDGNIRIKLLARDSAYFCLEIVDDGIGLPHDFDRYNRESMGMTLMEGLSGEMDGHFSISSKNGTQIEIVFKYTPVEKQGLVINTTEFITENVTV